MFETRLVASQIRKCKLLESPEQKWGKVVLNYHCNLATLWRIPLKMQDRHLRQQNLTLFRNTHGALLYLLTLDFTLAASRILETQTNSLSCQRKWFTWLSKSRRVWSRHNKRIIEEIYTDQAEISGTLAELSVACTPRITPQPWHDKAVPVSGNKDWLGTYWYCVLLLTWFAYQIKNSNTAQDTRRTWFRTSGRDKLPSGYLFQHPQLLIHKPFYDACIHCICFCQAQACFPLHSTCHWPVTSARLRSPYGWPGFQKLS